MFTLWKYLLKAYFQFFLLCVSAFVSILLVIRFQEIALFASSGANALYIVIFSLYQIPYILPIAIPISCLIAAMILFQRMSHSSELTALRSSGISLSSISYPLILSAFLLSVINFTVASELTPVSRLRAKNLIYRIATENPLVVLQKDSMLDVKTVEFDLKSLHMGKKAKEVLCIVRQSSSERIGLFTAAELSVDDDSLKGTSLSLISSANSSDPNNYDHLILENQKNLVTDKAVICDQLIQKEWFAKEDLLSFSNLLKKCFQESFNPSSFLELLRRGCLGFCPLSFTFIGIAFGINIGRHRKKSSLWSAFLLATFIMVSFVLSKTIHHSFLLSSLLYLLPQPFAILYSLRSLMLSSRGIE
jgi:lipopolysaccharide export system permease protein